MSLLLMWVVAAGCGERVEDPVTGTTASGLYYEAGGAGDAVVLIHGFSLDRRMWGPQIGVLERGHRVIRYDLRGHGRSAGIMGPFSARADLLDVLDALGVGDATLVGLSAGAQVAVDFALTYPDRVRKLVLASPGLGGYAPKGSFDWLTPVLVASGSGHVDEAVRLWVETPMMAIPTNAAGDSLMRVIVGDNAKLWTYRENPEEPMLPPAIGRLAEIRVPTLIVVGGRDVPDIGWTADTLHACIAGSQLEVIPTASHMVNLAEPAHFTELVAAFLDRPAGGTAIGAPAGC